MEDLNLPPTGTLRQLVSPVGGPHRLRGVGRGDGGGRGQWRREKNAQVPPRVEAKRGGGRGGSGVDSSPRPAVAPIGASTRHAKTPLKTPPHFVFSSPAFGN
jgi:hypothetical protein